MKKSALRVFIALTSISISIGVQQNADAAIFKCVNAKAEVYYNDKPCPVGEVERQLRSIKDPKGGYIPPAFTADVKAQGSKGVVVGEKTDENNNSDRSEGISDSESIDNSNSSGSSGSNDLDTAASNDGAEENIQSTSTKRTKRTKRTKPKGARKTPKPTIPLKKEIVTREPRSKIN